MLRRAGRVVLSVYREQEPAVAAGVEKMGTTCTRGCTHCCKLPASMMLPEAAIIVEHLTSRREWPKEKAELLKRVRAQLAVFATVTMANRHTFFMRQLPCVFLVNDECSIYAVRPGVCRYHFVVSDPSHCALGAADPQVALIDLREAELRTEIDGAGALGRIVNGPIPVMLSRAFWSLGESWAVDMDLVERGTWTDMPFSGPVVARKFIDKERR